MSTSATIGGGNAEGAAGVAAKVGSAVLSVPGNLLLLGEYAVLEPGGLGITVAVQRRVEVRIEAAAELKASDSSGRGVAWKSSDHGPPSLIGATIAAVERELFSRGCGSEPPSLSLRVDSSALFDADGTKIGLGSSAAVAVGVAYSLLRRAGLEGARLVESTFRAALEGHRAFQGGRGSGYDVAASLYGGFSLFVGGVAPSVERLEPTWLPPFGLVRGSASVDTARAVERYEEWKLRSPAAAQSYLEASNEIVRGFAAAKSWNEGSSRLREGARLAAGLGESIGVPARVSGIDGLVNGDNCVAKALGAGDELIGVWRAGAPEESWAKVEISDAGPLWSA